MRRSPADFFLLAIALAVMALEFGLFPVLFTPSLANVCVFIAFAMLTEPLHFGLMHETMHGNLRNRDEGWNRIVGRMLGIGLGLPWETMRFGHLAHHGFNRHDYDRPESLKRGQSRAAAALPYFFQLVIGNALLYAVVPILTLLPASGLKWVLQNADTRTETATFRAAAIRSFTNPARQWAVRIDLVAIVAFDALAIWLWGKWWPVFVVTISARWIMLSLIDNAPHYGMPLDSGLNARDTHFPQLMSWLVLNQNFHGMHHHNPQLHWQELPAAFAQSPRNYNGSWFTALLRQFRGPVELS